ncbi:recombinase family protein [Streptomyces sp. NPDC005385]|uniref:recombinase family protein n=1 Tax=Streptomyces sp. NPDC005385 TaxID=3157039 RepID=UPI0033B0EE68
MGDPSGAPTLSTTEQGHRYGTPAQRQAVQSYAARGPRWHLVGYRQDTGASGSRDSRPGFDALLADIAAGPVRYVAVDRLMLIGNGVTVRKCEPGTGERRLGGPGQAAQRGGRRNAGLPAKRAIAPDPHGTGRRTDCLRARRSARQGSIRTGCPGGTVSMSGRSPYTDIEWTAGRHVPPYTCVP